MFSIYTITNNHTHQVYVGMTSRLPTVRFSEHCRKRKTFISAQIRSVGKQDFTLQVVAQTENRNAAFDIELQNIIKQNTLAPNGYNIQCRGIAKNFLFAEQAGQLNLWS